MALHKTVTDSMEEVPERNSALKGAMIIGGGSLALVVGAFLAIVALTAPNGWISQMSHASIAPTGEEAPAPTIEE